MRSLICRGYGSTDNLKLEDCDKPEPGADDVLVRVLACGANASDWEFVTGYPAYARLSRIVSRSRNVFGSDIMGEVDTVGDRVTRFRPGDRVLADTFGWFGGFSDYAVAPERLWVPVPDTVDDVTAAALPQSGTIALNAMRYRVVGDGSRVLVNGAGGGSGPLLIQMACTAGATVWAVDNADKFGVMVGAGADHVIDYLRDDFTALPDRFDLIVDLWGTHSMHRVRRLLAPGGVYLLIGGQMGPVYDAMVSSLWSRFTRRYAGLLMVGQGPDDLPALLRMVESGGLRPAIGKVATLQEAPSALEAMGAGKIRGKLVIVSSDRDLARPSNDAECRRSDHRG